MIFTLLIDELRDFIEKVVKNYWLETNKKDIEKPPQVVAGYLSSKKPTNDEKKDIPDYPYVICRLLGGEDTRQNGAVTIKIIIGTYSEDEQNGWRDVANIIQKIWIELFKKQIVANQFKVEYPMSFEMPEEQPFPEWVGWMNTTWIVAHPVLEGGLNVE